MNNEKVYQMDFSRVYPLLVNKALKKGRTKEEVDEIICWLTGYSQMKLEELLESTMSYAEFFQNAPELNPNRNLIKGTVCGVRVEEIQEPLMREIRCLDKLIDELAKGRKISMADERTMKNDADDFISALTNHDLKAMRKIPKADLHNHFVLGGSREYIKSRTGYDIDPIREALHSMDDMHKWSDSHIGSRFNSSEMRKLLIEAAFVQAKEDGVSILEIGEDVWGLGEFFSNDIDELISAFTTANQTIAPEIELRLQIGLSRHCPVDYLLRCLEPFWGRKEFYSIDLYGDELAQPIENFIPIYKKARGNGLRLKAHIGEWGTAEDVVKGVELLSLDEVQHGIAAASSKEAVRYLQKHQITLNITPTSNVLLGRVAGMKDHPIKQLYREGVPVTVNSDDILMFDSGVSKEYLALYEQKVLTAAELNDIREKSLQVDFLEVNP